MILPPGSIPEITPQGDRIFLSSNPMTYVPLRNQEKYEDAAIAFNPSEVDGLMLTVSPEKRRTFSFYPLDREEVSWLKRFTHISMSLPVTFYFHEEGMYDCLILNTTITNEGECSYRVEFEVYQLLHTPELPEIDPFFGEL